ncbi:MAG: amino acid adenylation domain-containing protein, partial [Acidobacteria bacterium]|nr:amino acid adenylation domain-containing protein [Acidobacteriota bacterium]
RIAAGQSHRERDYWLNRLSGDLEKTIIPHDGQKNGTKGDEPRTDIVEFGFHEELFSRLMQLSNKSDYRLYILMVTGLVLLIYKYTAQKDIIVASPTYRQDVENELINTILVLRNRVKTGLTIKEFLLQIAESIFEADENQNYPIETLLYKLNLPDTLEDLPFTDIAILLENVHDRSYLKQTRFNMLFTFCRKADGFEGRLEYNGGLYEKNFIERLIVHFTNLLRQCLFGLDLKVADIDILNNQEKEQLLEDFNGKKVDFPRTGSIDRYVEAHAGQTPDRVAVGFEDSHLTYRCLNGMAGQLAAALRASGIGEDCLVGIMADRSPLVMACILAVWKAGGAYIPIDCDYPTGRIIEILQDSGARILFTWARHVDLTLEKKHKEKIMLLDHFFAGAATTAETLPDPDFKININSLAYVIYTSGSTGKPKGVMVEHLGMINHIQVKIIDLQLSAQSIVAQNSSYTFDISVWQFFAALIPGGKTVIYPYTLIIEPNHFIDRITRDRVTVLEVVPSYLAVILEVSAANFKRIESLRYLLVTGEELKHHLVEQWFETYPGIIMVNAYGPTEASDDITHYIMDRKSNHKPVPIGLPLPNMGLYILDQDMKLCPIGIKGEIYVSGVGVGRGYLNDQNKTARAFIISSIGKDGQVRKVRLYKTGDLGAWLPDGNIQFFGRKDHQVKIRGYRIELEEIEWNLTAYPSIKKAVVMERKNPRGIQSLCAYLVPHERLDIPRIREYLSQRLPAYMVPDYFIELDRIPLTPNGKIDRKALSEVKIQSPLGLPFISEGMLKKGINSTLSRKSQVQRLTVEETEKSHDNVIRTLGKEHSDLQICLEKMADSRTHYSLSYPQRMMYYIEKRSPGTACNNVVYTIKYPGKINCSLLEQAINHVLYKNEALRLRVVEIEHESSLAFAQYVSDYIPIKIDQFDFSGKENEMTLAEWLKTNACRGFYSLDSDLFYFAYIQFDEKTSGYYLKLHHIICDAVSIHFLIKEINKIYQHLQSGKSIGNEKNPSYLEYISFEQEYLTSGRAKADMQFWLDYLLPPSQEVQLSERMAEEGNTRAHMLKLQFPQSLNREIYRYCDNYKTTLYRLILAALGIYISRACAVNDMVIGTLNNNRSLFKYTRMFGIFIGFIVD